MLVISADKIVVASPRAELTELEARSGHSGLPRASYFFFLFSGLGLGRSSVPAFIVKQHRDRLGAVGAGVSVAGAMPDGGNGRFFPLLIFRCSSSAPARACPSVSAMPNKWFPYEKRNPPTCGSCHRSSAFGVMRPRCRR